MNKIKVIDLLNKIAKGEEVPKKIKYNNTIFIFDDSVCDYQRKIGMSLFISCFHYKKTQSFINEEVEIIEDNNKIEKIKITDDKHILNTITNSYNQPTSWGYFLANKINEIIDKLEELDNDRNRN